MMRSLRLRLILSHLLPLFFVILVVGVALDYVLGSRILLTNLAGELTGQAVLVAEIATDRPELWQDPVQAQATLDRLGLRLAARAMLLDSDGRLLASTDPGDAGRVETTLEEIRNLDDVLAGKVSVHTNYSLYSEADVVDVLVPAWGPDGQVIGAVRLTHQLANVYEQFLTLRFLIAGVLAAGLVLGTVVAWSLAVNLGRSLQRVTQAVHQLAASFVGSSTLASSVDWQRFEPLAERGPDEIRVLLRAVNALVERLQTMEQTRRRLLANLVHELGRPLGALLSAAQALEQGADQNPGLRQEIVSGMVDEIGRLGRLLDDLTHLYDQIVGALELKLRPVSLTDWLADVLTPWREEAFAQDLDWQVSIPTDLPTVEIDVDRLAQALGNLLSNAIKFTPPGGTVVTDAGVENTDVWIRVSDTGPGIAPEYQERIFTPFYRSHADRRYPQGMGLGLSIARDLVLAHDGRLELTTAPGQGTCFRIWLSFQPNHTP